MEIILKNTANGERFTFPMLPEKIECQSATRFTSYDLMNTGEVKLPLGEELTKFSWGGILPGEPRKAMPYVTNWQNPKVIQEKWVDWRSQGVKLMLTITGTPINQPVYMESFTVTYQGGFGDYSYTISFIQAKEVILKVESNSWLASITTKTRPAPVSNKRTHTVKKGDCLWAIAQKYMGAGSKYPDLYAANKSLIDARNQKYKMPKYTIYPGQVLTIP